MRDGRMRDDLVEPARRVANGWLRAGVEATAIELLAERVARWADLLTDLTVSTDEVVQVVAEVTSSRVVGALVRAATPATATSLDLGALAVHLLDIAEAMALQTFVPELPALHARSDRSGDAARNVGLARHLKG